MTGRDEGSAPMTCSLCPGIEQGIKTLRAAREFLLERRDAFMCQHDYEQARVARNTADAIKVAIEVVEADGRGEPARGQRWIPVSERLPEARKSVLVVDTGFSFDPFIAWLGDRGQWEFGGGIIIPPTHWMPLPGFPS